ncbi:MAG: phosphoenolpyruvate carboxykinase [Candidatus Methanoliparum thermophilum]|uniref:phosphoenolpyruvate carboxykinase (ATP) n=1 Tax=Methanoliparum thermophilum TaxID=2491083 RepID=A0A520KR25_METT2|nr:phosphoenolpyruvate carboxykinase [Candidatus Methanoliparum sp. LAM-1]RZN64029.1 MAG: phosphoenolpyruvate carboxykinase [Candidatus Methanoliparum thermophilum]BDC35717.1 hypothetical protein MTLP_03990 [Candidatus Methanoliparum sp. LAM-1]
MELDLNLFETTAKNIRERAIKEGRLLHNPSDSVLRDLVLKEKDAKLTKYGNIVVRSEPSSRSEMFTKNSVDYPFGDEEFNLLKLCEKELSKERLISIDRIVGEKESNITVRLTIPEKFAHVAYGGGNLFYPAEGVEDTTYEIIMFYDEEFERNKKKTLSKKDITIRLAMLDNGRVIKIVRNSNYIGEYKKGVFACEDWAAKKRGGIFLHAGCREDHLQSVNGDYNTSRSLFVALSANGKTTTVSKILARKSGEVSWLVQDDGGTLMPDGSFHGFEGGGIFVKTEGVDVENQTEIFYGLLKENTLCENVYVTDDGDMDFYNYEMTSNGRAVICRRDFMHASRHISVDRIDNFILITRGAIIPAISKMSLEEAMAMMVLGLSIESSAGNPEKAGSVRSVFFYDPFMSGDKGEHANRLYKILSNLPHVNYYLLNTGGIGIGEKYKDISLNYTISILDSLIRGGLTNWIESPAGFKVPASVRGVDSIYFHPERLFSVKEFKKRVNTLNKLRSEKLNAIDGLDPKIKNVFI